MAGPSSTLRRCFFVLALLALLCLHVSFAADHHFEGFDSDDVADDEEAVTETLDHPPPIQLTRTHSDPPPPDREQEEDSETSQPSDLPMNPSSNGLEYWDEEEFEGIPEEQSPEAPKITENATPDDPSSDPIKTAKPQKAGGPISYTVEIVCVSFLIMFAINFFTGKRENENIALAWAAKFGARDSIFDKNFSLVGVGEGDDPPLLLKEEQNVFKFYASGRRYCSGLLATMELQSRHDLISRLCNWVMRGRDEISFEVYMNEEAMDQVVFAVARRKAAKGMQKEVRDLQRYGSLLSGPPGGRKWVAEELAVISESKEVAGDLITEAVLDQVKLHSVAWLWFKIAVRILIFNFF